MATRVTVTATLDVPVVEAIDAIAKDEFFSGRAAVVRELIAEALDARAAKAKRK